MVMYGGDEVSALVLDIGTSSIRAGYAGEDLPRSVIPTSYGITPIIESADVQMNTVGDGATTSVHPARKVKMHIGQDGPSLFRHGMEVKNPMQDGLIQDFTAISPLISHALVDRLCCTPSEHPLLLTEPPWNTPANRERMAEIMFEEYEVPALFVCNTGVLNAFAAGTGTALVVDIGQAVASVAPVVEGYVLRKGIAHSALPKLIQAHVKHILSQPQPQKGRSGIQLLPYQLISSKEHVEPNATPKFKVRDDRIPGVTASWREWYEAKEVEEWTMSIGGVLDQGWNDQVAATRSSRLYEFPTGYNTYFGPERFAIGEQFFTQSQQLVASNPNLPKPIPTLISQALSVCEIDLQTLLLGNVVLTGGGSLVAGLADRLSNELTRRFNNVKIHAPGNAYERRYGGWLGGSILASMGSFHQLWISREEWQEHGKSIIAQRCK